MNLLSVLSALTGSVWKKVALGLAVVILMAVLVALAVWRGYRAGYTPTWSAGPR